MSPTRFLGEFEQMVLLAILQEEENAFALEVRRTIEECTGRKVSRGAFYTTLDRMERKALLAWEALPPPDDRTAAPLRRYAVTAAGVEALRASRAALDALSRGLDGLLEQA